jgi:membrane protein YqaA with SNARE-associated domain
MILEIIAGYVGVFISSLAGSATVIFPIPSFLFVVAAGVILNPILVGMIAGLGAALGELVGYGVGYAIGTGGRKQKKYKIDFERFRKIFDKNRMTTFGRLKINGFVLILIFAATPLPDDVLGLFCGAVRYDIRKFFLASLIGKIILYMALAYAGFYGADVILSS